MKLQAPFLKTLKDYYRTNAIQVVDFQSNNELARLKINDHVRNVTRNRIVDLLAPGTITPLTNMVALNTLHFKGQWMYRFNPNSNRRNIFNNLGGSTTYTDFMTLDSAVLSYFNHSQYLSVGLLFRGGQHAMTLYIPREGHFLEGRTAQSAENVQYLCNLAFKPMQTKRMQVTMPKFRIDTKADMEDLLKAMGMKDSFKSGAADFSRINGQKNLFISKFIHNAIVSVDENGVEASAASAAGMSNESIVKNDFTLTIDRPFIFYLHDKFGNILFQGQVVSF